MQAVGEFTVGGCDVTRLRSHPNALGNSGALPNSVIKPDSLASVAQRDNHGIALRIHFRRCPLAQRRYSKNERTSVIPPRPARNPYHALLESALLAPICARLEANSS